MCLDAHVLLEPHAVEALLDWIKDNPDSKDMVSGPYIGDNGEYTFTHWRQEEGQRPGYWGVWDGAFLTRDGFPFCVWNTQEGYSFRDLNGNEITPIAGVDPKDPKGSGCFLGGRYTRNGYTPGKYARPYEIPSQGLGLFTMRKDAWPGLSPLFKGFGGEEGYIHEKVRRAGGKCLSLPALRWRHCFRNGGQGHAKQHQVPYPMNDSGKGHPWNLLIGHRELGIEATDLIRKHFAPDLQDPGWNTLKTEAETIQPWGTPFKRKRMKILGVWYTNNAAPPGLLNVSLNTILRAKNETFHHDVEITTASWETVNGNPFPCVIGKPESPPGHMSIIQSIKRCISQADSQGFEWDGICFLEHDVLYPPNYFDRMGNALADGGSIIVNLDYEGMNKTGWCRTINRHEPMHQMCMDRKTALENLDRAEKECLRNGGCLLEPDSMLPCNAETETGMLAIDFDGTATAGWVPFWREFVVITGRLQRESAEVRKVIGDRQVYYRSEKVPPTDEGVASHKVKAIQLLEVVEYWEDNPVQAEIIRRECPDVIVHTVSGHPVLPDRSHWVRLPASAHENNKYGLCPSIHVNW
jgi:hypothetical protein